MQTSIKRLSVIGSQYYFTLFMANVHKILRDNGISKEQFFKDVQLLVNTNSLSSIRKEYLEKGIKEPVILTEADYKSLKKTLNPDSYKNQLVYNVKMSFYVIWVRVLHRVYGFDVTVPELMICNWEERKKTIRPGGRIQNEE
jgi:N-glycosylase/DNA lyase